jgi:hypothetical protein
VHCAGSPAAAGRSAQEGAAHTVAIGKAGLPGDDIDRMLALLHHQPGGFDTQIFHRFGRRLAGLRTERLAKLGMAWF